VSDIEERLEAAFRKRLEFKMPKAEDSMRLAIGFLTYYASYRPRTSSPKRERKVGRAEARKELDRLAHAADVLNKSLANLSATSLEALGGERRVLDALFDQSRFLSELAKVARETDLESVTAMPKGRPIDARERGIAEKVVGAFKEITGIDPDRDPRRDNERTHGLKPLLKDVFTILGVDASARKTVDAVMEEYEAARGRNEVAAPIASPGVTSEEFFARGERRPIDLRSPLNWKRP
jgi:hypothetical protein